jgi:xanthine dehydrogenase YagR molybdenum-binding subunit
MPTNAPATTPASMPTTAPGLATASPVGRPMARVDGWAKVTGRATYAAEAPVQGCAHAVAVGSTIAAGSVRSIDAAAARRSPGVLAVLTHATPLGLQPPKGAMAGETRLPLADAAVHYAGQFVAVVVADTLENARAAASLVAVEYDRRSPVLRTDDHRAAEVRPTDSFGEPLQIERGQFDAAVASLAAGTVVLRQTYTVPTHTHNPMEMNGTVAAWDGGRLTVWDATQGVVNTRDYLAGAFGLTAADVRVLCPFVGGGFGCKGPAWPHTLLAAAAARVVGRPVKLTLTRRQMFTNAGHRPPLSQAMTLAATADGKLTALGHETTVAGSALSPYVESCGTGTSRILYAVPNLRVTHAVRQVNVAPPTFMRAPGENPGLFALESALDELAERLNMDPVQLRLANYAERHPETHQPWSSKHLGDCYRIGAERFGWAGRDPTPRSTRSPDGKQRLGWGMATATYPAMRFPATARIRLYGDPGGAIRAIGAAATQDLGTGAYTVFTQITAALTGLPLGQTKFELGDSDLPAAFVSGGSSTTASVGQALADASLVLRATLLKLAGETGRRPGDVRLAGDHLVADDGWSVPIAGLIARGGRAYVEGGSAPLGIDTQRKLGPSSGGEDYNANARRYAFQSFGAHFVEVSIDPDLPRVRVERVVSVMDVGRIVNPRTARSQVLGGVVMGLGMALMEETNYDAHTGRPATDSLADYPVCTNADVRDIDVTFVGVPDPHFNAIGCRGVGEIGITGVAAAVANAVYHATGRRCRDLPITPDKLL